MKAHIVAPVIGWIAKAMGAGRGSSALLLCLGMTSCIPMPSCDPLSPLEIAANYEWAPARRQYVEPLNAWVRNKRVERFLDAPFRSGGIESLKSQFGFECEERLTTPPCGDCYVCRVRLSKRVAAQEDEPFSDRCTRRGDMLVQVDTGPRRDALKAMTYWNRPPVSPPAGK